MILQYQPIVRHFLSVIRTIYSRYPSIFQYTLSVMQPAPLQSDAPIELIAPTSTFQSKADRRTRMAEPLPVKLITIDHATLPSPAGLETQLDEFYVNLLGFERAAPPEMIIYHAENFDLQFDVLEPPVQRETLRALGIEVPSLAEMEQKLIDREIPYTRQKSIQPGMESLLLLDPAGNWIELTEFRPL
jgi:hypothetical protein